MVKHDKKVRILDQRTTVDQTNSGGSPIEYGRVVQSSKPGDPCQASFFGFRAVSSDPAIDSYAHSGWTDIEVHDPFFRNCAITEEIITCHWDAERHRMQFIGSHGLVRQLKITANAPGSGDTRILTCSLIDDLTINDLEIVIANNDMLFVPNDVITAQYIAGQGADSIYTGSITGYTVEEIKKGEWSILYPTDEKHFLFELFGDLDSGSALASLTLMDGTGSLERTVNDPIGMFAEGESGARGICVLQRGEYYVIQLECPEDVVPVVPSIIP